MSHLRHFIANSTSLLIYSCVGHKYMLMLPEKINILPLLAS